MGTLRTYAFSVLLAALLVAVALTAAPHSVSAEATVSKKASFPAAPASATQPATAATAAPPKRDAAREKRELQQAKVELAKLQHTYRYLDGITLRIDPTPGDAQAVAYYTDNEIVINPGHVASIEKILAHEVWHIIDWRDNGRLDWGEDLPPSNTSTYRSRY
jgi:hypothetical protein